MIFRWKVAREFGIPAIDCDTATKADGRPSKASRPALNLKLWKPEEPALCRYIDLLDRIYLAVRPEFVTYAANPILRERSGHIALVIGTRSTYRPLKRHGYFKKLQRKIKAPF